MSQFFAGTPTTPRFFAVTHNYVTSFSSDRKLCDIFFVVTCNRATKFDCKRQTCQLGHVLYCTETVNYRRQTHRRSMPLMTAASESLDSCVVVVLDFDCVAIEQLGLVWSRTS